MSNHRYLERRGGECKECGERGERGEKKREKKRIKEREYAKGVRERSR